MVVHRRCRFGGTEAGGSGSGPPTAGCQRVQALGHLDRGQRPLSDLWQRASFRPADVHPWDTTWPSVAK